MSDPVIEITCCVCGKVQPYRSQCIACEKKFPKIILRIPDPWIVYQVVEVERPIIQKTPVVVEKEVVVASLCPICKEKNGIERGYLNGSGAIVPSVDLNVDDVQRNLFHEALAKGGNIFAASKMLGIGKTTAYQWAKRYGVPEKR